MLIMRRSPITNEINELDIAVTQAELDDWYSGTPIQIAMPRISADEREFIKTGLTVEDWNNIFKDEE